MKKEDLNNIKNLLDKYNSGKTSLEEEAFLYDYFSREDVASELVKYQAEFQYYTAFKNIPTPTTISVGTTSIYQKIVHFLSKWYFILPLLLIPAAILLFYNPAVNEKEITTMKIDEEEKHPGAEQTDASINKIIGQIPEDMTSAKNDTESGGSKTSLLADSDSAGVNYKSDIDITNSNLSDTTLVSTPPLSESATSNVETIPKERDKKILNNVPLPTTSNIPKGNLNGLDKDDDETFFDINENSTTRELARIARLADKAGIEYVYVVDQHKKQIQEINITMRIRKSGVRSQLWITVPKMGSFSESFGWTADENGLALTLSPKKIDHQVKAKHTLEK